MHLFNATATLYSLVIVILAWANGKACCAGLMQGMKAITERHPLASLGLCNMF